ncbi:hypothetical protein ZZ1p0012 [Acinetobacter phage ZZ1]|uniref:Uncharacterized protein n=3 Tax=Caudoviricetes TaxID=2731619 RepID=A0A410T5Q5_9CAUD|nr:hypothetical protein ZZ1p0012 [Acinetobacter phage ZZ1]AFL47629.1 hypothetical protein ZZ1p0012 [Acinetobacter phage ZZ1]QAU04061.1 hypothetical protein Henu6_gp73 [Acinetobacter phage Henu6]
MKVNLINGLIRAIEAVEQLPQDTEFSMGEYKTCVIGKTFGWSTDEWGDVSESRTIRRIFGIKKPDMDESGIGLFADWSYSRYTERTWKVIKLFTSDIGPYLTRDEWLKKAYNVLGEFK